MTTQTLKGFRDFLPKEKRERDVVLAKIVRVFQRFGFEPLETPTLEYASLLLGKYGDEADKLVYHFLDNGQRDVGLRYDQTVPTARVLANYQHELPKFWRRYQTQNVFRADKPQKGRYREFTQCDIDIFGTTSALADADVLACSYAVFQELGCSNVLLKINDRQTLVEMLTPFATETVSVFSLIQSIDKLDKMSSSDVCAELVHKGVPPAQATAALDMLQTATPSAALQQIMSSATALGVPSSSLVFTPTLARGLDYYTGMIFEIVLPEYAVGSCGGGGRYDHLIEQLGGVSVPAVGMALGFDRTVEAVRHLGLLPAYTGQTQVLLAHFDDSTTPAELAAAQFLRKHGIATELYPVADKLGRQFAYADKLQIPAVLVIGPEEASKQVATLKLLQSGQQITGTLEDLIPHLETTGQSSL